MFVWLCLFPKSGRAQDCDVSGCLVNHVQVEEDYLQHYKMLLQAPISVQPTKLPLEWRGAFLSFDAENRYKDRFSQMNYGVAASAVIGYKQYSIQFETIAPLSAQDWLYRVNFKYQIF